MVNNVRYEPPKQQGMNRRSNGELQHESKERAMPTVSMCPFPSIIEIVSLRDLGVQGLGGRKMSFIHTICLFEVNLSLIK